MDRYSRNKALISEVEQSALATKHVTVLGCGGLGGYIIEMLARLGIGKLTLVDYDTFDETNLNRQLLSNEKNLGISKVEEASRRVSLISSSLVVDDRHLKISGENIEEIIKGADLVIDALDSIPLKIIVENSCSHLGIPLVHGAIGGWIAQVAVVMPGEFLLKKLYGNIEEGLEKTMGNPSFTPALTASIQVSEALKLLLNRGFPLSKEILYIDLETNDFSKVEL